MYIYINELVQKYNESLKKSSKNPKLDQNTKKQNKTKQKGNKPPHKNMIKDKTNKTWAEPQTLN